jgi:hypothetical protein
MPPLPGPRIVLPEIFSPRASMAKIAASPPLMLLALTSPSTDSSEMPLRPELTISQSVTRIARPCATCSSPRRSGSGIRQPQDRPRGSGLLDGALKDL